MNKEDNQLWTVLCGENLLIPQKCSTAASMDVLATKYMLKVINENTRLTCWILAEYIQSSKERHPEAYLKTSRTSTMELSCKKNQHLKAKSR